MYLKHFGFQRAPFELVPDPDFLFLGEAHDAALANLVMGLRSGKGFVAISGPVGAGKTTVLRALLRRVRREGRVCFLSQPESSEADLLLAVLDGFGLDGTGASVVELRRRIREFLQRGTEPGILIVDEAHLLSEDAMEQLRLLSNLEEDSRKLLQIVLSGQPELKELLSRPRLRSLAQRIEMFYDIRSLGRGETAEYVDRRLRIAGGPEDVSFEASAVDLIHHCSAGVPRLINLLADRSLVAGYVGDTGRITADLVREAYEDLGEVTHAVMPGAPPGMRRSRRDAQPEASPGAAGDVASGPRASVVPLPRPVPRRARPRVNSERWLAALGLAAVVALAVLSLGGRRWTERLGHAPVVRDEPSLTAAPAKEPTVDAPAAPPHSREKIEPASVPSGAASTRPPAAEHFAVHVASFRESSRAETGATQVARRLGVRTSVAPVDLQTGRWYRVLVGDFATRNDAKQYGKQLEETGEFSFFRSVGLPDSALEVTP